MKLYHMVAAERQSLCRVRQKTTALKQQASLHRRSVVQAHENSRFSWTGMNQL
jgi:hypothetical protein